MGTSPRPEITWSLLHPQRLDPDYLRRVVAAAAAYRVDSFEICGEAHRSSGGVDGVVCFRDTPAVRAHVDRAAVEENVRRLRECIEVAHGSGRPVTYWHREVMVPRAIVESVPGLLDADGEFDLLGEAYHRFLRAKLAEFFEQVPALDGLVLTLTESDYSVIHNSNPARYPPAAVVAALVSTFAEELQRRGKRFVLRSFGSIARDYEDILAGAAAGAGRFDFEIETKITPYDFSPFLPFNPYLRQTGRARLSAEYDSIGEFLGAGYLPAPDPERVIASVRHAQRQGVDRHVIRVDRIGHATFESAQAINLLAFDRAIQDPAITADQVWREWSAARWPGCAAEMTAVMRTGIEVVKRTHFIDGHLIFHAFPIDPTMKWIKASGILSVFAPGTSLRPHDKMWGIRADAEAPERAGLLREKDEALALADAGWRRLQELAARLSAREYRVAEIAWRNAVVVTRLIRAWCACVAAYGVDLAAGRVGHPTLNEAIAAAKRVFADAGSEAAASDEGLENAYARPLWAIIQDLIPEFEGEWAERAEWRARPGLVDLVVCGGIADDGRVRRAMHASHAQLIDGRPARAAGNRVFPNGAIECELAVPPCGVLRLVIKGDRRASCSFRLVVNGRSQEVQYDERGYYEERFAAETVRGGLIVRLQKSGRDYPWFFGVATIALPDASC